MITYFGKNYNSWEEFCKQNRLDTSSVIKGVREGRPLPFTLTLGRFKYNMDMKKESKYHSKRKHNPNMRIVSILSKDEKTGKFMDVNLVTDNEVTAFYLEVHFLNSNTREAGTYTSRRYVFPNIPDKYSYIFDTLLDYMPYAMLGDYIRVDAP